MARSRIQRIGGKMDKYLKYLQSEGPTDSKGKPKYSLPEISDMIADIKPLELKRTKQR